jgi:hypothetical protein
MTREELLLLKNGYRLPHLAMNYCLVAVLLGARNIVIKLMPLTMENMSLFNLLARGEDAIKYF